MNNHHNGTGLNYNKVAELVKTGVKEALAMANGDSADVSAIGEDTYLIGQDALLDSMGLVTLVVDLEQRLEEEYDLTLVLADERAMSQKNSPFRSVGSLADYICRMIEA